MITAIVLILAGILGASALIIKKMPSSKSLMDKMLVYQGWLGVVLLIWGIIDLFDVLGSIKVLFAISALVGIIAIVAVITELVLGFTLGYGLIAKYVLKHSAKANEHGEKLKNKLMNYQVIFGIIAIILGLLYLIVLVL